MKTYTERAQRAYMAGQTELADLFEDLAKLQARADALGDLLADAMLTLENIRDGYPDFAPGDAERWLDQNQANLNKWLE